MARISRSTLAMACSWAALRRDRRIPVVAMSVSFNFSASGSGLSKANRSKPNGRAIDAIPLESDLSSEYRRRPDLPSARPYAQTSRQSLNRVVELKTLPFPAPENLTVATTGASGSIFLKHFLLTLESDSRVKTVNFIASDSGLRVMAEELAIEGRSDLLGQIIGAPSTKIQQQANSDIGANVASGSYPSDAMVVIPCSVGTLGRIANGTASRLIERAADVTLKERRPLVLCVRETPLNKIHLRNMSLAADAGATIFPLIPTFYNHPSSADAMAQEFANRVLAHIGLAQPDAYRWKG